MSNEPKAPGSSPAPLQPLKPPVAAGAGSASPSRAKLPSKHDELRLLINSRHPIITVETPEEERLEVMLMEVAAELGVPLFEWSVTAGLAKAHGAPRTAVQHRQSRAGAFEHRADSGRRDFST